MNLFHDMLREKYPELLQSTSVEEGVGGKQGAFRVTAPKEFEQQLTEMLTEASRATGAIPDVEYGMAEGAPALGLGLSQAINNPALAERYAQAFQGAGLRAPTVGQATGLAKYGRELSEGSSLDPSTYTGPTSGQISQYYNALINAGIDVPADLAPTPLPGSVSGEGPKNPIPVFRGFQGANTIDPRYFRNIRNYRGGGSRALTRALGG